MRLQATTTAILALLPLASAGPAVAVRKQGKPEPLPLLIWHGLGDNYENPGLHGIGDLANATHPGTYVKYIHVATGGDNDRTGSFFGKLPDQLSDVCESLANDTTLQRYARRRWDGRARVDALGFSQGGQFLRGLVETCPAISVRSLVTFGSQHNGIADVKPCGTWDLLCKGALALMRGNVWAPAVQSKVVPAQYYRTVDPETELATDAFVDNSGWLADINNERREPNNKNYIERIAALEKFVMVVFEDDTTVVPKESGWFFEVILNNTAEDEDAKRRVIPLQERKIYKEDWLGLRKLDEKGGLVFNSTPGDHMQLDEGIMRDTFKEYFGPEKLNNERANALHAWCESDEGQSTFTRWTKHCKEEYHEWHNRVMAGQQLSLADLKDWAHRMPCPEEEPEDKRDWAQRFKLTRLWRGAARRAHEMCWAGCLDSDDEAGFLRKQYHFD